MGKIMGRRQLTENTKLFNLKWPRWEAITSFPSESYCDGLSELSRGFIPILARSVSMSQNLLYSLVPLAASVWAKEFCEPWSGSSHQSPVAQSVLWADPEHLVCSTKSCYLPWAASAQLTVVSRGCWADTEGELCPAWFLESSHWLPC